MGALLVICGFIGYQSTIKLSDVNVQKQTHLRVYDLLGRYGGEEFLVIANTDADHLKTVS
jgi:hypothetical protein